MQRRTFIKAAGGIGAASATGVGVLFATTSGVTASSAMDLGEISLSSDDGTIDHVSIYGDGRLDWKGLDTPATQIRIKTVVTVSQGGTELVTKEINNTGRRALDADDFMGEGEETSGPGTRGSVIVDVGLDGDGNHDPSSDWAIIQASDYEDEYGLPQNPVSAHHLTVDDDGGKTTFRVDVETQYKLYDANDNKRQQTSATDTFDVEVQNIKAQSSAGNGDGDDGPVGGVSNNGTQLD